MGVGLTIKEVVGSTPGSCSYQCALDINQLGTDQWAVMLCGWEGNRRPDIALALRYIFHLQAQGFRKRDDHPAYALSPSHFVWNCTVKYPRFSQRHISRTKATPRDVPDADVRVHGVRLRQCRRTRQQAPIERRRKTKCFYGARHSTVE